MASAEARWNKMMSSGDVRKDQVDACNERGEPVGKARQPDVRSGGRSVL